MRYLFIVLILLFSVDSYSYDVPIMVYEYDGLKNIAEVNFDYGPAILINTEYASAASPPIIDFFIAHEYAHIVHGNKGYLGTRNLSRKSEAIADCYAAKSYSVSDGSNLGEVIKYFNGLNYIEDGLHLPPNERAKIIKACSSNGSFEKKYEFLSAVKTIESIKAEHYAYVDIDNITSYLSIGGEMSKIKGDLIDSSYVRSDEAANSRLYKANYLMKYADSCEFTEKTNASKSYDDVTYSCTWSSNGGDELRQLYYIYYDAIGVFYPNMGHRDYGDENNLNVLYKNNYYESSASISFILTQNNKYDLTVSFNAKSSRKNTKITDEELSNYVDIMIKNSSNNKYEEFENDYLCCKRVIYRDDKNNISEKTYRCLFTEDVSSPSAKKTKKAIRNILKYKYGVRTYKNPMAYFDENYSGENYYLDYNNRVIEIRDYRSSSKYDTKGYEVLNFIIEIHDK